MYRDNASVKKTIRMIGALQFVPADQINPARRLI
jgi:hypothetical protein